MHVVLIGRPGVGKGTQSKRLAEHLGVGHIATGDLLREEQRKGTARARQIAELINHGNFVPDELVMDLVRDRLAELRDGGCIFDGIPRKMKQAELLEELLNQQGKRVDLAVELEVDEAEAVQRMLQRAELEGRADDTPATIAHRMQVYQAETYPLVDHYRKKGVLQTIDGSGSPEQVFESLRKCAKTQKKTA